MIAPQGSECRQLIPISDQVTGAADLARKCTGAGVQIEQLEAAVAAIESGRLKNLTTLAGIIAADVVRPQWARFPFFPNSTGGKHRLGGICNHRQPIFLLINGAAQSAALEGDQCRSQWVMDILNNPIAGGDDPDTRGGRRS